MKELIECVNDNDFLKAYKILQPAINTNSIHIFDFLFDCLPDRAYEFLHYCISRSPNKLVRFMICNLLAYGDVEIMDHHAIIYANMREILREDPHFSAALEFIIYNYFEHPESPFSNEELLYCANELLKIRKDSVAQNVVKLYKIRL